MAPHLSLLVNHIGNSYLNRWRACIRPLNPQNARLYIGSERWNPGPLDSLRNRDRAIQQGRYNRHHRRHSERVHTPRWSTDVQERDHTRRRYRGIRKAAVRIVHHNEAGTLGSGGNPKERAGRILEEARCNIRRSVLDPPAKPACGQAQASLERHGGSQECRLDQVYWSLELRGGTPQGHP